MRRLGKRREAVRATAWACVFAIAVSAGLPARAEAPQYLVTEQTQQLMEQARERSGLQEERERTGTLSLSTARSDRHRWVITQSVREARTRSRTVLTTYRYTCGDAGLLPDPDWTGGYCYVFYRGGGTGPYGVKPCIRDGPYCRGSAQFRRPVYTAGPWSAWSSWRVVSSCTAGLSNYQNGIATTETECRSSTDTTVTSWGPWSSWYAVSTCQPGLFDYDRGYATRETRCGELSTTAWGAWSSWSTDQAPCVAVGTATYEKECGAFSWGPWSPWRDVAVCSPVGTATYEQQCQTVPAAPWRDGDTTGTSDPPCGAPYPCYTTPQRVSPTMQRRLMAALCTDDAPTADPSSLPRASVRTDAPSGGLTGMRTSMWTVPPFNEPGGYAWSERTACNTVYRYEASPLSYRWTFSDSSSEPSSRIQTTTHPGSPSAPAAGHVYNTRGDHLLRVDVTWRIVTRDEAGQFVESTTATIVGVPIDPYRVLEARGVRSR